MYIDDSGFMFVYEYVNVLHDALGGDPVTASRSHTIYLRLEKNVSWVL